MKRLLLTLASCCLFSNYFYAQKKIEGMYSVQLREFISCDIDFYKDGYYNLFFIKSQYENSETTLFSYGKVSVKGDKITLFDTAHGFQIKLSIFDNGKLQIDNGLFFLSHKLFDLVYKNLDINDRFSYNLNPGMQRKEREEYLKNNLIKFPFYYDEYKYSDFSLKIQKQNKYTFIYNGITISEGSWKRNGNELVLTDIYLQYPFYVLIGEDKIISKYLPGDYNGISLYRKNGIYSNKIDRTKSSYTYRTHITHVNEEELGINDIFMFVEDPPQFPNGGEKAMQKYITENTQYPKKAREAGVQGRVIIRCVIEKDGTVSSVTVAKKLSQECDEEAIRVIKSMPKWIPGKHKGVNVAVKYTIMVNFDVK